MLLAREIELLEILLSDMCKYHGRQVRCNNRTYRIRNYSTVVLCY